MTASYSSLREQERTQRRKMAWHPFLNELHYHSIPSLQRTFYICYVYEQIAVDCYSSLAACCPCCTSTTDEVRTEKMAW